MANNTIFCHNCGKPNPAEAKFCYDCGQQLVRPAAVEPSAQATPVNTPMTAAQKKQIKSIVISATLVLLSLILFIFSFCPILTSTVKIVDDAEIEVGYSAIDNITLMFDSFKELDDYDIRESDLQEELLDLQEELDELEKYYDRDDGEVDTEDFLDEHGDLFGELLKINKRIDYQRESYSTTFSDVLAGVIGLLYILLTLALLVFSSLHLIFLLIKKKISFLRLAIILLCCIPATIFILYYFTSFRFHATTLDYSMSPIAILALIFSLLAIGGLITLRVMKSFNLKNTLSAGIGALCALLVIAMLFVPVFSATAKGIFDGRTTKREASLSLDAALYEQAMQDDFMEVMEEFDDRDRYERFDDLNDAINEFFRYSKREVENGKANQENYYIAAILLSSDGETSLSFTILFYLLLLLAAGAVLTLNLIWFTTGFFNKKLLFITSIVTASLALLTLIMAIVATVIINGTLGDYHITSYDFSIGAGAILALIFSLAPVIVPIFLRDKRETFAASAEHYYDIAEETPVTEVPVTEVPVTEMPEQEPVTTE